MPQSLTIEPDIRRLRIRDRCGPRCGSFICEEYELDFRCFCSCSLLFYCGCECGWFCGFLIVAAAVYVVVAAVVVAVTVSAMVSAATVSAAIDFDVVVAVRLGQDKLARQRRP